MRKVEFAIAEIKLRAERRLGDLLAEIPPESGKRTDLTSFHDETRLQATGITRADSHRWQKAAVVPMGMRSPSMHLRGSGQAVVALDLEWYLEVEPSEPVAHQVHRTAGDRRGPQAE